MNHFKLQKSLLDEPEIIDRLNYFNQGKPEGHLIENETILKNPRLYKENLSELESGNLYDTIKYAPPNKGVSYASGFCVKLYNENRYE